MEEAIAPSLFPRTENFIDQTTEKTQTETQEPVLEESSETNLEQSTEQSIEQTTGQTIEQMQQIIEQNTGQTIEENTGQIIEQDMGKTLDQRYESIPDPSPSFSSIAPPTPHSLVVSHFSLTAQGQPLPAAHCILQSRQEPLEETAIELVALPAGTLLMGSPEPELGRDRHESPLHPVTVKALWMARFPITQIQWRKVARLPTIHRSLNPDPSYFKGDQHPVEQVSWLDAIEFCDRLSQLTQRLYRLPSEAEWEYACRAASETPFHFGETLNPEFCNYDGNDSYGEGEAGIYRQSTVPVGSLASVNAFGLADMHGNVWEWCADLWHETYHDAPSDSRAWDNAGDSNRRVLRGGAWYCPPALCRSAQRHWGEANHSGSGIGFRVVCDLECAV
jgi:formylglycine-generating enzyme required for sulfatase activity